VSPKLVTSLDDLTKTLGKGRRPGTELDGVAWLVTPDNWFEIVEAARSASPQSFEPTVVDPDGFAPLTRLALGDLVAVYEVLREWWPLLGGPDRPESVAEGAHDRLLQHLRELIHSSADHPTEDERVCFALPGIEHELNMDAEAAALFWKALLWTCDSPSLAAAAEAYASTDGAEETLMTRPWLRTVLQRVHADQPSSEAVANALRAVYEDPEQRERLLEADRECFAGVGVSEIVTALADELGLNQSLRRSRPFSLGRPKKLKSAPDAVLTALVPSYGHEDFIAETLKSLRSQTRQDIHILVVDDCSPDDTVEVARAIADPRIEVRVNSSNLGLGNSVLQALETIETPYVALVNSDDVVHPKRFEKCLEPLEAEEGCQLVSTGLALIDAQGKRLTPRNVSRLLDGHNIANWVNWFDSKKSGSTKPNKLFGELLERNFLATSSNIVCRRQFLVAHKKTLKSLAYCLDWQLFLDAAREGALVHLPQELLGYRLHGNNTVWFEREDRWRYNLEVNRVAAQAVRDHISGLPKNSRKQVEAALRMVSKHLKANTETDALGLYLNELLGGPVLSKHSEGSKAVRKLVAALETFAHDESGVTSEPPDYATMRAKNLAYRDEADVRRRAETWLRTRVADESERVQEADDHRQQIQAELDERQAELERQTAELERQTAELEGQTAELERTRARLEQTLEQCDAAKAELAAAAAERERLDKELADRDQRLEDAERRGEALRAQHAGEVARRKEAETRLYEQRANERMAALYAVTPAARRVTKWRRKRAMIYARLGLSRRGPKRDYRRVIVTGERDELERRALGELLAVADDARIDPVFLRWIDGALARDPESGLPDGLREARLFGYPEVHANAEQSWQRRAPDRLEAILTSIADSCGDREQARQLALPALSFADLARSGAPVAIYATGFGVGAARARIAAALLDCRWGFSLDTLETRGDPLLTWLLGELGTADCIIARSQALATAAANDRAVVRHLPPHAGTSQSPDIHHVVSASHPCESSDLSTLIEAVASPALAEIDTTLFLTGDPDSHRAMSFEERLLADRERCGVRDRVDLRWGLPTGVSRDAIYVAADHDVDRATALSTELLDAMAEGLAIVATDAACHGDLVVDGDNGIVVPAGAPERLAAAIAKLHGSVQLRAKLGGRALATYGERFADEHAASELGSAFARMV